MIRFRRPDWRMVVALVAALAATLIYSVIQTSNDEAAKQQSIEQLIGYVQRQDQEFAADRTALLTDQSLLLAYTKSLADREEALLAYLRAHGIKLPVRLVTSIPAPRLVVVPSGVTGKASKSHGKGPKK